MSLIYDPFTLGEPDNQITFNDFSNATAVAVYRAEARYATKRTLAEFDIKLPEVNGIADFQTLIGSEMYIIRGEMYPQSEDGFHQGRRNLRKVADLTTEQADVSSDNGYVPVIWNETVSGATAPRQLFVKPIYVDMTESVQQGIVQPFVIFCKVKDPTIYSVTPATGNTGSVSSYTSLGGASGYSFGYPVSYSSSITTVSSTVTNAGDVPAYPTITVTGTVTNPRITNTTTGEYIQVNTSLGSTSDVLIITYNSTKVSITLNGNSVYNNLAAGSTLFKVKPGAIGFSLTGTNLGTAATATISLLSAWPLA